MSNRVRIEHGNGTLIFETKDLVGDSEYRVIIEGDIEVVRE